MNKSGVCFLVTDQCNATKETENVDQVTSDQMTIPVGGHTLITLAQKGT